LIAKADCDSVTAPPSAEDDMAKGAMRPGKEARKPKKDAKKPVAAPVPFAKVEPARVAKPKKDK
jgi:hypothetical protein